MNQEELIQGYFNQTLSQSDIESVHLLLKQDETFVQDFEDYKNLQNAFLINEKKELQSFLNDLDQKPIPLSRKILNYKSIILAIASCIIIGLFYFNSGQNATELYESYFDDYPNVYLPVVRGSDTSHTNDAFTAYENQNYLKAEKYFEQIISTNEDYNLTFYYAMSLINQNKTDKASIVLNDLKSKQHKFLAEVYWYSALISVKNKKNDEAINDLKSAQKSNPDFNTENIQELLKKLK